MNLFKRFLQPWLLLFLCVQLSAQSLSYNISIDELKRFDDSSNELTNDHPSLNVSLGVFLNPFIGQAAEYSKIGNGADLNITYSFRNKFHFGLSSKLFNNQAKLGYPYLGGEQLLNKRRTSMSGIIFGKSFGHFNAQADVGLFNQSYLKRSSSDSQKARSLWGISPGVKVLFPIQVFKNMPTNGKGAFAEMKSFIDLNLGIRYLSFFDTDITSGFMLELGCNIRFGIPHLEERIE